MKWTNENIPDLTGKVAIVTGANSGLGFEITKALADHGCEVVMACRNLEKGNTARETLQKLNPNAKLNLQQLDLSNLQNIANFCGRISVIYPHISLLINNAAILNTALHQKTADGFGLIMGTNHLGTFALTAGLLPLLSADQAARIVTVSSDSHKFTHLYSEDVEADENNALKVYAKSKLANLLFAFELAKRLKAAHLPILSVSAHPGIAATHLSDVKESGNAIHETLTTIGMRLFGQSAAAGALPILYAATAPDVNNGEHYGPDGFGNLKGYPKQVRASKDAYDAKAAQQLWFQSEQLTHIPFLTAVLENDSIKSTISSTSRALQILNEAAPKLNIKPLDPTSKYLFQGESVEIKAQPSTVWNLMTDINHYYDYSKGTLYAHMDDQLEPKNTILFKLYPSNWLIKLLPSVHLTVTVVNPELKILGWSMQLPLGLGTTQRYQILENIDDYKVRSHIIDHIPGVVGFFSNLFLREKINNVFTLLNQGFREKAEASSHDVDARSSTMKPTQ